MTSTVRSLLRQARLAKGLTQGQVRAELARARRGRGKMPPKDSSLKRMYTSWESGAVHPADWQDELCEVFGLPPDALGFAKAETLPTSELQRVAHATTEYGDAGYLESVLGTIQNLVSLDNKFGGGDLVQMATRHFTSIHSLLGAGAYDRRLERDLNAAAGELAEVAGWLAYDAEQHDLVRRLNHEALFFTRLAGDRSTELLTTQNMGMHAEKVGRPNEALQLARSVLESDCALSPRLRSMFLIRKARALAQMGDDSALSVLGEANSLYLEGASDSDPHWAWWIDDRELAWHVAMAKRDLKQVGSATDGFEHSVEATAPNETRNQYSHRAYLLQAQVEVALWNEIEGTVKSIIPLVHQVASTRSVVVLRKVISQVTESERTPDSVDTSIAELAAALDASPVRSGAW